MPASDAYCWNQRQGLNGRVLKGNGTGGRPRCSYLYEPTSCAFAERIGLFGDPIDEGKLAELLARVEEINAGEPITFFEVTTAAAFLAFAEHPADLLDSL